MGRFIIRRVLGVIPVLFIISLMIYGLLLIAPGGPEARFAQNPRITQAQIEAFRHRWGLDQPIPVQYCRWLGACNPDGEGLGVFLNDNGVPYILPTFLGGGDSGVVHGDLGYSIKDGRPVTDVIADRIVPTFILAGTAYVIWVTLAFISGVIAAVRRYGVFDTTMTVVTYIGLSLPTFWLGLMLITIFAAQLKILPAGGMWTVRTVPIFGTPEYTAFFWEDPMRALVDLGKHLILPVFTLVAVSVAGDSRFVRSAMLDSLNQDYVRTARAKGVMERTVIRRHALRNALLPIITNIGLEIPFLFTGAIVTETIFTWPGMGRAFIEATELVRLPGPDGHPHRDRAHRRDRQSHRRHHVCRRGSEDQLWLRHRPTRSRCRPSRTSPTTPITRSSSNRSTSGRSPGSGSSVTTWPSSAVPCSLACAWSRSSARSSSRTTISRSRCPMNWCSPAARRRGSRATTRRSSRWARRPASSAMSSCWW